jgi:hypothetical protein
MVAIIEFFWQGQTIQKYINTNDLFNDIKDSENLWVDFIIGKTEYQFQIFWNSSEIAIFLKGGVEPIYYISEFSIYFNRNLK